MSELKPSQEKAIALLASGQAVGHVAESVGISRQTLWEWRRQPEFEAELNKMRLDVRSEIADKLRTMTNFAVDCLWDTLQNTDNENLRTKISLALLNREQSLEIGSTDPEILRDESRQETMFAAIRNSALSDLT